MTAPAHALPLPSNGSRGHWEHDGISVHAHSSTSVTVMITVVSGFLIEHLGDLTCMLTSCLPVGYGSLIVPGLKGAL